jgi:hypothetical protein
MTMMSMRRTSILVDFDDDVDDEDVDEDVDA